MSPKKILTALLMSAAVLTGVVGATSSASGSTAQAVRVQPAWHCVDYMC